MKVWVWIAAIWLLTACAVPEPRGRADPLLYNAQAVARADHVVVGIPGALTSVRVLAPMRLWATRDRAMAYYRLPGFDGRPGDDWVHIAGAAGHIAALAGRRHVRRIDLVGHSTGAVIALEAAKEIRRQHPDVDVRVHAISTALPAPQPVLAGLRGAAGTVAAAWRARSLKPRVVWLEYYRRLAYGPDAQASPQLAQAADALVAANDSRITLPEDGLARRHTRALRQWTNPDPGALRGARLTFYHGAVDPVFPPRQTARFVDSLPDGELRLIPGHGHLLLLTYPQVWEAVGRDVTGG
ncbi:MAG: alpha/beta hydrolase [Pseudomonadota bacterium]